MNESRSISPFELYGAPAPIEDAVLIEHLVVAGETISGLAHRYYDDWRLWRVIAARNNLADVRRIAPGIVLLIPEQPLERGVYESF